MSQAEIQERSTLEMIEKLFELEIKIAYMKKTRDSLKNQIEDAEIALCGLVDEIRPRGDFQALLERVRLSEEVDKDFEEPAQEQEQEPEPAPEAKTESKQEEAPTTPDDCVTIPEDLYDLKHERERIRDLVKANPERIFGSQEISDLCNASKRTLQDYARAESRKVAPDRLLERRGDRYYCGAQLGGTIQIEEEPKKRSPKKAPDPLPESPSERQEKIINFLAKNPKESFMARELAEKADAAPGDVYAIYQTDRRKDMSKRRIVKSGMKYKAGKGVAPHKPKDKKSRNGYRDPSETVPYWNDLGPQERVRAILQYNKNSTFEPNDLAAKAQVETSTIDSIVYAERDLKWNKKTVQKINGLIRAGNALVVSPGKPNKVE